MLGRLLLASHAHPATVNTVLGRIAAVGRLMDAGQGQTDAGQWTDDSTGSSGTGLLLFTDAPATQMPAQLMWSFAGSHLSDGSSMHLIPLGHFIKGLAQGCFGVLEDLDSEDDIFP